MKYDIDRELKSLSLFSGGAVGRLYPLINFVYRLQKCRSNSRVTVKKYSTPGYEGENLQTLVIEPKNHSGTVPCIIFFHGGGFLMSASSAHYQIAKWYAERLNCKVIMPDYRLLPENKYPVAIEDCYNTYLWALENAGTLEIDKDMIIVTGDSAGGNIAGAVTAMLNNRGYPVPKGLMLIYPVLDKRMKTGSMKRFTDTPIWDSRCNKMFWDMYLEDPDERKSRYASISEIGSLDYFPETYIEVAEYDCLHDEGVEFADRLRSEGISAEVHEIKGACHGYESALKSSLLEKCLNDRIDWMTHILGLMETK